MNNLLRRYLPSLLIIVCFVALNGQLLNGHSILILLRQASIIGIGALGVALIAICDGFLLSSGSQIALAGMVIAMLHSCNLPMWLAVGSSFMVAASIGIAAGWFAHTGRIPILVVSFGMEALLAGVASVIHTRLGDYPLPQLSSIAGDGEWGMAVPILLFLLLLVLLTIMDRYTTWGRVLHGIGEDYSIVRDTGLPALRIKLAAYASGFMLINLCGLITAGRVLIATSSVRMDKSYDILCILCLARVGVRRGEGDFAAILPAAIAFVLVDATISIQNITILNATMLKGIFLLGAFIWEANRLRKQKYVGLPKKRTWFFTAT